MVAPTTHTIAVKASEEILLGIVSGTAVAIVLYRCDLAVAVTWPLGAEMICLMRCIDEVGVARICDRRRHLLSRLCPRLTDTQKS